MSEIWRERERETEAEVLCTRVRGLSFCYARELPIGIMQVWCSDEVRFIWIGNIFVHRKLCKKYDLCKHILHTNHMNIGTRR